MVIPARSPAPVKSSAEFAAGMGFGAGKSMPAQAEAGFFPRHGLNNAEQRWDFGNSIGALAADAMRA
jgi:hypothetical protein